MEADRQVLCGPKGRHQVERPAWRGGSVDSQVTLGGRQIELPRLRVRSADGEVPLASFQWAAATDPLDEHTLAAVAAGVSTRRYAGTFAHVLRTTFGLQVTPGGLSHLLHRTARDAAPTYTALCEQVRNGRIPDFPEQCVGKDGL